MRPSSSQSSPSGRAVSPSRRTASPRSEARAAHRGRRGGPAHELRGDEHRDPVHQAGLDEGAGELAAGLEQQRGDVEGEQPRADVGHVHPPVPRLALQHGHAARGERGHPRGRRVLAHRDQDAGPGAGPQQRGLERQPRAAVHHHAIRLTRPRLREPHGEGGVVGQHGADAGDDGVALAPQPMCFAARRLAGDPPRPPIVGRDLAVEGHGPLRGHVRALLRGRGEERVVELAGLGPRGSPGRPRSRPRSAPRRRHRSRADSDRGWRPPPGARPRGEWRPRRAASGPRGCTARA